MKRLFVFITVLFVLSNINAQTTVNGILDSSVSFTAGAGNAAPFSFGIEEYANIRFQSRLRDNKAVFYGAVNLIAAAGDKALAIGKTSDQNYAALIELERLYFRLNFDKANFDGGLFRLPFGYSTVWGPSDFLNPKNPLKPDARPRGVIGAASSFFPAGDLKLNVFAVSPRNPFLSDGSGVLAGVSSENHWGRASAQALYSFETPNDNSGSKYGIHRTGFSLKADIEIGLVIEALYSYNHEAKTKWDGLSFSAGADYSFIDGKLIVMAEYLYNGENSSTAKELYNPLHGKSYNQYLYSGFTWLFNDFTNINLSLIYCIDNTGFTPMLTFNHDLFQGASLMIMAYGDFDYKIYNLTARIRLRF